MKKLIALLLAAALCFSLTGCFGRPEILGTYHTEVDLYDIVVENFDKGTGLSGTEYSLENYLEEFKVCVSFTFNKDGTYSMEIKSESIATALDQLKAAVLPLMNDRIFSTFKDRFTPYGFTIESQSDIESIVGMTWDEVFSSALGKTAEEFVDTLIDESFVAAVTTDFHSEGKFTAKKGQLRISNSLDTEPPEDRYETYEIDGDTVTITGAVNLEENIFFSYPYVLTKVETAAE